MDAPATARDVLRILLAEPLRFTPTIDERRRAYALRAPIALDQLVSGVIELKLCGVPDETRTSCICPVAAHGVDVGEQGRA